MQDTNMDKVRKMQNKIRETNDKRFAEEFHNLSKEVHINASLHGWWEKDRSDGECIALMHSWLSAALEASRNGNQLDKHIPEFLNLEVELADCIISIMDFAVQRNLNVAWAIIKKIGYNETRPYKHGKEF